MGLTCVALLLFSWLPPRNCAKSVRTSLQPSDLFSSLLRQSFDLEPYSPGLFSDEDFNHLGSGDVALTFTQGFQGFLCFIRKPDIRLWLLARHCPSCIESQS